MKRACAWKGSLRSALPLRPSVASAHLSRSPEVAAMIWSSRGPRMPTRESSRTQPSRICLRTGLGGKPMYWRISARSTNARSIASVILLVVKMITFLRDLSLSICVRSAFTTRIESDGSEPDTAAERAAASDSTSSIRIQTRVLLSSASSWMYEKSFPTNLPLSENHLLNRECELISSSSARVKVVFKRILSFCASAWHSDVFPVPGGPCNSTTWFHEITLWSTLRAEKSSELAANSRR
mmetsp:Transcript_16111/g.45594  ORF Transcript_16111/g.45594 Transcript_16111/m.45594 type:complete len:239 (-) Transcript_16111:383-1099(-)